MPLPSQTPEYEIAIQQQEFLKKELTDCLNEYDHLIYHRKPILESEYADKIGRHKLLLLQIQTETLVLKRKIEMMQAAINRNENFDVAIIEMLVDAELKEHIKRLNEESQRVQEAIFLKSQVTTPEEGKRLRELYYSLVRKLHPDVNIAQTDETRAIWLRVQDAYKNGDLSALEALAIVSEKIIAGEPKSSLIEEIKKRNEIFSKHIKRILSATEELKTFFPFTLESFLKDAQWIKNELESIEVETKTSSENKAYYIALYEQLTKSSA